MSRKSWMSPAVVAIACLGFALPAYAQRGGHGGGGGGGGMHAGGGFGGGMHAGGGFGGGMHAGGFGGGAFRGGAAFAGNSFRGGGAGFSGARVAGARNFSAVPNRGAFGNDVTGKIPAARPAGSSFAAAGATSGRGFQRQAFGGGYDRGRFDRGDRSWNGRRGRGFWPGAAIGFGLAAGYPYYGYGYDYDFGYGYPDYAWGYDQGWDSGYGSPGYGYAPAGYGAEDLGGVCVTPRRTCNLINAAPVGADCSCKVPGGRASGTVDQ